MGYLLFFTSTAQEQLAELESRSLSGLSKQVKKTLGYLETNPRHPSLRTHEFTSLKGIHGKKIFEAYAQNNRLLSKLADTDEVQGVDGAQELSVYNMLDAPSTGATPQFAASVEFRKKSNTPGAYRIFWHYSPDLILGEKRTAVITIIAITSHP